MGELNDVVVSDARAGDPDAVGLVYAALAPQVQGYLRARGVEDPEGLTSEVFLQVITKLGSLRGGSRELRTFVFSVAHARVVDEFRRRSRRPATTPYEPSMDTRSVRSAESAALEGVGGRHLHDVLARLSDDQRAVVTLRVLGDLTLEQTADVIGKSVGAVKQLQRRGLLELRSLLERGEVRL